MLIPFPLVVAMVDETTSTKLRGMITRDRIPRTLGCTSFGNRLKAKEESEKHRLRDYTSFEKPIPPTGKCITANAGLE